MSNGRAHLNLSLSLDATPLGKTVADVERDGLVPKTGAPDPYHGFMFPLTTSAWKSGYHEFHARVVYPNGGVREINNSPRCYKDAKLVPCQKQ